MNTDLLDKKLIGNDVTQKVWSKIDKIAEAKGMTRQEFKEWSEAELYRSNISEYEYDLIFAYQVNKAIERLEINNKDMLANDTKRKYSWLNRFKDSFNKVDKAIKHLTDVCSYIKRQEGKEYDYKWLLDYDDVLFDRIVEGNEKKDKKYILKRND